MITNEERREVARRIRKAGRVGYYSQIYKLVMGEDIPRDTSSRQDEETLADRLADLIEPETGLTCKREKFYDGGGTWYEGCSKCRNPLEKYDVFCSKCGKKVVNDND